MVDDSTEQQRASRICFELWGLEESERPARMAELCLDDDALLKTVRRRMARAEVPDDFLEAPLASSQPRPKLHHLEIGDRLGPFRLTREIHQGGMGEVFEAVREQPFEQRVAIKVVRPDRVDSQTLQRFDEERRILARLEHPHIAAIVDGGRTAQGHPYLVMEYVDGERIDDYCDRKKLSVEDRIALFVKVCSAVTFAHQNTIIHRDLKPSNILVTDNGRPVLLDFGIAKSLSDMPASEESSFLEDPSQTDGFVGTLLYASPEQACGSTLISTRSDVFSLGIILYELLAGYSPYAGTSSLMQLVESIEKTEPVPASQILQETRQLRGKGARRQDVSVNRQEKNPHALQKRLRGELDAILTKALKKRASQRYSSVEALAADLRSYLQQQPVAAFGQSPLYGFKKLLQRHRLISAAAVTIVLLLTLTGILGTRQQRLERHHQEALQENQQKAEELRDLIVGITQLAPGDPFSAEVLRQEIEPRGDQAWLALFLNDRGIELEEQGRFEAAEILYREALAMKTRLHGPRDEALTTTLTNLGDVLAITGQFEAAEKVYLQDLDLSAEIFGDTSADISRTQLNLAVLYQDMGRLEAAAELIEKSLTIRAAEFGKDSMRYAATLNAMAYQRYLEGDYGEAEALYQQIRTQLSELDIQPATRRQELDARVLRNLALVYGAAGDAQKAEAMARQALATFRMQHVHWRVADAESVLGSLLQRQGRSLEATPLLRDSYPIIENVKGHNARQTREARERLQRAGLAPSNEPESEGVDASTP